MESFESNKRRILFPGESAPKKFIVDEKGNAEETELSKEELEKIGKLHGKKYMEKVEEKETK